MAGIDDELLDEHTVVAEAGLGFRAGAVEAFSHLRPAHGDAHALAAATGRGLDHDGIADLVGYLDGVLGIRDLAEIARYGRDLGTGGSLLALDLVAHGGDGAWIGADEDDSGFGQRHRKGFPFGQEAIAWMYGLRAGLLASGDDLVDQQIGFGRGRWPDMHGLIGHFDMQRIPVGVRKDRNGLDTHPPGGFDDPASNFTAIGDQDLFEHGVLRSLYNLPTRHPRSVGPT